VPKKKADKKPRLVLTLDGDKLGLVAATLVCTVVMAVGFFVREAGVVEVLWRGGLAFVGTYAATFFLVRWILRCVLTEFAEYRGARKHERAERLRQEQAERSRQKAGAGVAETSGENE